jgi:putative hydrolase of the HAD superfamily
VLEAVAFDLWETLITDLPEIATKQQDTRISGITEVLSAAGVETGLDEVARAHRDVWHDCWERYWSCDRDVSARGQVVHFLEHLGVRTRLPEEVLEALEEAYGGAAVVHPPVAVDGADELVDTLRAMGLRIGVVSNTGRTPGRHLRQILDRLDLAQRIDGMVFSNELGECKPRPAIFENIRRQLGCEFERMVFVGDNPFADVWGAQQCGMTAVHFDPPARGMAVGSATRDDYELAPHARIERLLELVPIVEAMMR